MSALNMQSVVRLTPGPLAERLDDEIAILHPDSGLYFGVKEEVGRRIWELLQEPTSLQAVTDRLLEEYEVSLERCREDVQAFATRLLDAKLIAVVA